MKNPTIKISGTQTNKIFVIALILLLTIAPALLAVPVSGDTKIKTYAYASVIPATQQIGNSILINAWITPPPPIAADQAPVVYHNLVFTITKPDSTTETQTVTNSEGPGTVWWTYTPNKVGTYTIKLSWAGDDTHEAVESPTSTFTVQEQPIPTYPENPLPTGYWTRPISAENRAWYQISGDWLFGAGQGLEHDGTGNSFNANSKAPNSAHILWTKTAGIGGLIGGSEYGSMFSNVNPVSIIMLGRVYFVASGYLTCVDLRTGQELWKVAGSGTLLGLPYIAGPINQGAPSWALGGVWTLSNTLFTLYDSYTGAVKRTFTPKLYTGYVNMVWNALEIVPETGRAYVYMTPIEPLGHPTLTQIVKWDLTRAAGVGGNYSDNIVWDINVTTTQPDNVIMINVLDDVVIASGYTQKFGYNKTDGSLLWSMTTEYQQPQGRTTGDGKTYFSGADMKWHAYDIHTGNEVWASEAAQYPWGVFWAYGAGCAYGNIYVGSYDGYEYCFSTSDGSTVWKYYVGDDLTGNTAYGTWPVWGNPAVADGKVFVGTNEHSPNSPYTQGYQLYCLDAYNGTKLWSIAGAYGYCAVGEGTLIAGNQYDGTVYAFDKGQTSTTVTASPKVVSKDSNVLIEGTVMDLSPAQPNTPAISDDCMTAWMEYLHMQRPMPTNATGVTVKLTAIDQNGGKVDLGTAKSDASGNYAFMWAAPSSEGTYKIVASFEGSNSYYASSAETAIGVGKTGAASVSSSPSISGPETSNISAPTEGPSTSIYIAVAAVIVIVAVAVAAIALRKRSK
jgi:outer membrane protein assembly factor BamB